VKIYAAELFLAIQYLHEQKILYRDLKPENILIEEDGHIKLTDFGLSKENIGQQDMTNSFCGSPAYVTPEVLLRKGHGSSADLYGIGAIVYELMVGQPAFYDDDIA
jgi:serine/threonine protein kinase